MSEQENSGHNANEESSMVMVEKEQTGSTPKTPFRPTELQDEQPGQPHIRSKAPAVPLVEELKSEPNASPAPPTQEAKSERKEEKKKSSERRQRSSKKSKRRGDPEIPETIALTTIEVEPLKEKLALASQPIPADVISITSAVSEPIPKAVGKLLNEDELAALAPKTPNRISEWSDDDDDDEGAGGLPRSSSRASRVSRAVRQLFCCGTAYSPPSEDDISTDRVPSGI